MHDNGFDELINTDIKILDSFLSQKEEERLDGVVYSWRDWTLFFLKDHFGNQHKIIGNFEDATKDIHNGNLKTAKQILLKIRNSAEPFDYKE